MERHLKNITLTVPYTGISKLKKSDFKENMELQKELSEGLKMSHNIVNVNLNSTFL